MVANQTKPKKENRLQYLFFFPPRTAINYYNTYKNITHHASLPSSIAANNPLKMQPITPLTVDYFVAKRTLGADLVDSVSAGKASIDDVAGEKKPAVVDVTVAFAAGGVGVVVDGRQTTAQPAGRAAVLGLGGGTALYTCRRHGAYLVDHVFAGSCSRPEGNGTCRRYNLGCWSWCGRSFPSYGCTSRIEVHCRSPFAPTCVLSIILQSHINL